MCFYTTTFEIFLFIIDKMKNLFLKFLVLVIMSGRAWFQTSLVNFKTGNPRDLMDLKITPSELKCFFLCRKANCKKFTLSQSFLVCNIFYAKTNLNSTETNSNLFVNFVYSIN